jgi:hypothetical protein
MNSEDINKQLNEVRKTMGDTKEEFSKDTEFLKNSIKILKMKSSIIHIKTQLKALLIEWSTHDQQPGAGKLIKVVVGE